MCSVPQLPSHTKRGATPRDRCTGRRSFTHAELNVIRALLRQKARVPRDEQSGSRRATSTT